MQEWKRTHPRKRPKYLLFYWRWAGLLERGRNGKFLVAELPHKLVAPSGRPPPESKTDVVSAGLMKRVHGNATLFADGAKAWKTLAKTKGLKFAEVSHKRMQFCKQRGPRKKAAGTQCIDRKWKSLKQWIPKELRNKQKITRDVNESIRDYVFAFVCRTNWGNANTLKNLAELACRS